MYTTVISSILDCIQCSGDEVAHALLDSGGGRSSGSYRGGGGGGGGGGGREGGRRRQGSGGAVVKARGLPFSTTEYELAGFFEEYDVSIQVKALSRRHIRGCLSLVEWLFSFKMY